jgi:hypothetical protein
VELEVFVGNAAFHHLRLPRVFLADVSIIAVKIYSCQLVGQRKVYVVQMSAAAAMAIAPKASDAAVRARASSMVISGLGT